MACVPSGLSGPAGMYSGHSGLRLSMLGVGRQSGPTLLRVILVRPVRVSSGVSGTEVG